MYKNQLPSYIKLVLILALLISVTGITNELLIAKNNFRSEMDKATQQIEQIVSTDFAAVTKHLNTIEKSQALQEYINDPTGENKDRVAQEFFSLASNNDRYNQIRFIDDDGKEKIRVDNSALGPAIISTEQLQDKSTRYYVNDTLQLNRGEIYVSPLDLNLKNGEIEIPYNPMVRFATPVYSDQNEKTGIIVINYAAGYLLPQRGQISQLTPSARLMLVNSDGFWLRGVRPQDEWGFMYAERNNRKFQNDFPHAWSTIKSEPEGFILSSEGVFSYTTIYPIREAQSETLDSFTYFSRNLTINDFYWVAIAHIDPDLLTSGMYNMIFKKYVIGLSILAVVCFAILAIQNVIHWYQRNTRLKKKREEEMSQKKGKSSK